jgi:ABC-type antimicrobial peptide transport system permease subunit
LLSVAVKLLLRQSERTGISVLMLVPVVALLVSSNMVTAGYLQQAAGSVSLVQPSNAYLAYQPGGATPSSGSIGYDAYVRILQGGASSALPLLGFPSVVTDGSRTANASVLATNTTAFVAARHSTVRGRVAENGSQADAGALMAEVLGIGVGDVVTVDAFSRTQTLTVVGILNSTDQSDTGLILPLSVSWQSWPQTANRISYVEFEASDAGVASGISGNMTVIREQGIDQIARSFDSQTANLLTSWTYVLFALSAAASIAAASRVVTEVSQEYETIRAIGARLSTARTLVFYELLTIAGTSVLIGTAAGIVGTSILATLFKTVEGVPLAPVINPAQLAATGTAAFLLILAAGSISLAWLPRKIGARGEAR